MKILLVSLALLTGCSAAANQQAMKMLTMSAEECAKIALANGRADIAAYCGITDSALDVLTASLADQTCALPVFAVAVDAGRD